MNQIVVNQSILEGLYAALLFGETSEPDPLVAIAIPKENVDQRIFIKKSNIDSFDPETMTLDISSINSNLQFDLVLEEYTYLLKDKAAHHERIQDLASIMKDSFEEFTYD